MAEIIETMLSMHNISKLSWNLDNQGLGVEGFYCIDYCIYKGVYPQRDESLAIVAIDASKGIIDLWVH